MTPETTTSWPFARSCFPNSKPAGLGEGGRVPDGQPFRHFLKIVQGAFPQFIDVNLLQNRGCFLLLPDCVSTISSGAAAGCSPAVSSGAGRGLGRVSCGISPAGEGVLSSSSVMKNVGKVFGFAGGAGPGAFIPDDEVGRSHFSMIGRWAARMASIISSRNPFLIARRVFCVPLETATTHTASWQ